MDNIKTSPDPASFFAAMKQYSYSMGTALADIIDNSITAGARNVSVLFSVHDGERRIEIVDDGRGMSRLTLREKAMRFECNPDVARAEGDLGKFGMGMKTAALSLGDTVTIGANDGTGLETASWDVQEIKATREWNLKVNLDLGDSPGVEILRGQTSGALVRIDRIHRYGDPGDHLAEAEFAEEVAATRGHLARVFHRFIENGLHLTVGLKVVEADDPRHRLSGLGLSKKPLQMYLGRGVKVTGVIVDPSVECDLAEQGFYFYRGDRLIAGGGWQALPGRMPLGEDTRLARVIVDIHPDDDMLWGINLQKDRISLPPNRMLRDSIRDYANRIQGESRNILSRTYGRRVNLEDSSAPVGEIWVPTGMPFSPYVVNRAHPAIACFFEGRAGKGNDRLVRALEDHFPPSLAGQAPETSSMLEIEPEIDPLDGIPHERRSSIIALVKSLSARMNCDQIHSHIASKYSALVSRDHVEHILGGR